MHSLKQQVREILSARGVRDQELHGLLTGAVDVETIVLRGHLVFEELLSVAVASHCKNAIYLKEAKLRFPQLLALVRALELTGGTTESHWAALHEFNSLRNVLAHRLAPRDLNDRVSRFVQILANANIGGSYPQPLHSCESLKRAIRSLFGVLSGVAILQAGVVAAMQLRMCGKAFNDVL
jgi:hypothetical protein